MELKLFPCCDENLQPIKSDGNKPIYYINGTKIFVVKGRARELAKNRNLKFSVATEPCIIRVLDYNNVRKDYCTHYWAIRGSRGVCRLCGEKKKFINSYSILSSTLFFYLLPCFDKYGNRISLNKKPLYSLKVKRGTGLAKFKMKFLTAEKADSYCKRIFNKQDEFTSYLITFSTAPYIVQNVKDSWNIGLVPECRSYITISEGYLWEGSKSVSQQNIAIRVKKIIKRFTDRYGEYKYVYFHPSVHPAIVRHFGGRYFATNTPLLCTLCRIVVPEEQVKWSDEWNRKRKMVIRDIS